MGQAADTRGSRGSRGAACTAQRGAAARISQAIDLLPVNHRAVKLNMSGVQLLMAAAFMTTAMMMPHGNMMGNCDVDGLGSHETNRCNAAVVLLLHFTAAGYITLVTMMSSIFKIMRTHLRHTHQKKTRSMHVN